VFYGINQEEDVVAIARIGEALKVKAKLESSRKKDADFAGLSDFSLLWFFYPYLIVGSDWKRRKEAFKYLHGSLLLDAGGGSGWFSVEAYKKGFSVVSLDVSKKSNKASHALMDIENVKIPLLRASLANMPFRRDTFDSIVCFEVIEHIENVSAVFSELHRVLKEEGDLFITTPNGYGAYAIIQDIILPKIGFKTYHVHKFTEAALRRLISRSGFQINRFCNLEFLGPIFMAFFLMLRKFCKREFVFVLKLLYPDLAMAKDVPLRIGGTWMITCRNSGI